MIMEWDEGSDSDFNITLAIHICLNNCCDLL